ncbi:hypothetical protein LSTR_LSTR000878 [Laodelphax striatellus]|uniref:ABC transporter domain-containing protein n=1 Tax=Laodelphax striatellus TaxID=195883 RepID=A0A482X0I1_LAOST|nr:hypothetical protein LSTR_LSTR000878 [Laodelphax striatellus]
METEILNNDSEVVQPIAKFRNAYKRYGRTSVILRGLNMTIPTGTIYGLLGPSGCGKTTLLSCIVGRKKLDSGTLFVDVKSKLDVGYMPQEVSLYEEFQIHEIFRYFGLLTNQTEGYIKHREKELAELLDLPPTNRLVCNLSGGQQRRVSMAVALFHNPKFLILDEPTVGLDPILCESIWKYFIQITDVEHKTIIITTHYIEEARNSHTIGLMRSGILLAETSPLRLMEMNNCSSLEEAFLTLSQKQEDIPSDDNYPPATRQPDIFKRSGRIKWHRFAAQIYKNVSWTRRNIPITAFMILLPFLLFTIFLAMLGKDEMDVTIGAVQDEITPGIDDCNTSIPIKSIYGCVAEKRLSCEFISYLRDKSYTVVMYKNLDEGITAVRRNKAWALLYFHKNYTESLLERIDRGKKASNMSLANSLLEVYPDNSIYYIAHRFTWDLHSGFMQFMENFLRNCEIDDRVIKSPLTEGEEIYESIAVRYVGLNGYIIAILYYLAMVYTSSSMVYEKSKGLFERTMVTGLTKLELFSAHCVAQTLMSLCQNGIFMVIFYGYFKLPMKSGIGYLIILIFLIEYYGMMTGFVIVEFIDEERMVTYFGISLVIMIFLTVGMLWPVEGMHWTIRPMSQMNPMRMAAETYRSITFRGLPFTNPLMYEGFLSVGSLVLILLLVYVLKSRND